MKSSLLLLFFFWFAAIQAQQGDYFVYISSLAPDNNAGIILLDFDSKTGQVQELKRFSDLPNTSYLNLSPDGKYLFTVYNNPDNQSALSSFSIRPEDGNLSLIDTRKNIGRGPCYVSVSTSGKAVLVANYVEGNVLSFQKKENGRIGKIISNIQHEFASKATERQE
ncbi:MAG: beta-propeller fold lactonase family protein, partial [Bacteroidetes bacterium]|nr:beta-propeller fold lactonase family protein [Bacteroidota bacterium]